MKSEIVKILISILVILSGVAVVDFVTGKVCDRVLTKLPDFSDSFAKENYRLERMTSDVVIIGPSRGHYHYDTELLGDSINAYTHQHYTIYNASINARFVNSNCCALESVLNRYSPKLIIFDIYDGEFLSKAQRRDDIKASRHHYFTNAAVRKYVNQMGRTERVLIHSSLYRYNGKVMQMISSFTKEGNDTGYDRMLGRMKNNEEFPEVDQIVQTDKNKIFAPSMNNFTGLLDYCKANDINIVIASSPMYHSDMDNSLTRKECDKRDIPFIDFFNCEEFQNNHQWFSDPIHLNYEGAQIYSSMFFQYLKPYLKDMVKQGE